MADADMRLYFWFSSRIWDSVRAVFLPPALATMFYLPVPIVKSNPEKTDLIVGQKSGRK